MPMPMPMPSTELIFDFPKLRLKCKSSGVKTVRFAPKGECHLYERHHESDHSKLFYNHEDYRDMRNANHQAIMDVHKKIQSLLASKSRSTCDSVDFNPDVLLGNENRFTPKLVKKASLARKDCISAVLREQASQYESGREDPDSIARASQQYSNAAACRARKIGLLQSSENASSMTLPLKKMLRR